MLLALAVGYPLVLLVCAVLVRWVGEYWWFSTLLLFLPPHGYALPLPFLVVALLVVRRPRWLVTQVTAAVLVAFPLMGLELPGWTSRDESAPTLKVMSFNIDSAHAGVPSVVAAIKAQAPDVVLLQELTFSVQEVTQALKQHFPFVHTHSRFVIASKYELSNTKQPAPIAEAEPHRWPPFIEYQLRTPLGELTLFNTHPVSPRGSMNVYRFRAVLYALRTGELVNRDSRSQVSANSRYRQSEIEALASAAAAATTPLLIMGDTNCPGPSPLLSENLAPYQDGFVHASWGFGYTYPDKAPWLRLDRIFASDELEFVSFAQDCSGVSDHRCLVAELQRR